MSNFYNSLADDVLKEFEVSSDKGLSGEEVSKRKEKYGLNKLITTKQKSLFRIFLDQFKSSMVLILFLAAVVSGVIGYIEGEGFVETIVILAILIVNAVIGTVEEMRAISSLDALNKMSSPRTKVVRDGQTEEVDSTEIVPGDIVVLDTGDIIPADMRLVEAVNLKIQESALTGESVPVDKNVDVIEESEVPLGDRKNMAFSTSVVTYGRGRGVIVGTGMNTEVGKIAHMLQSTEATETPMGKRLERLGKVLGYVALIICAVIFCLGMLYGNDWLEMFMMAVSLAVAAIPEGLQIVSTIVLAVGVQRLVKQHAIVRTLPSVETLGSTTVICSDKTGTLTQNKMTVVEGWAGGNTIDFKNPPESEDLDSDEKTLLLSSLLCTDSHLKIVSEDEYELTGDPTETAIVEVGLSLDLNKNDLESEHPRVGEVPFDSDRKRMSTINKMNDNIVRVNVKGGLDEILSVTNKILIHENVRPLNDEDIETIKEENERMAESALRVLAVAYKELDSVPGEVVADDVESDLVFVGLLGMIDPARPEVVEAVKKCKTAGIRPVMITGDHKVTAVAIASDIGIFEDGDKAVTGIKLEEIDDDKLAREVHDYSVYARVAPEHKVRIVKAWQSHGDIVAMTGDGVNDAPALKQADIGVAMGMVGTEVAKDASDVILTDDNFATIVDAVEEGRRIYDNILKVIQFLLSANMGEVLLIFIASLLNLGNPLTPILILWINLVTDSLPALALSMDPADKDIMTRKPRDPKSGIFSKGMVIRIVYQGAVIGLISLLAYVLGKRDLSYGEIIGLDRLEDLGRTMAFGVLGFSQLFHVRNLHSNKISAFKVSLMSNKQLLWAIIVSCLFMLVVMLVPGIREVFGLVRLDMIHWLYVLGLSLVPIVVVEIMKLLKLNYTSDEY
ncbi:MAG: calcium-translocating P-type ATPase, PMCA-type [Fermentimonas sp.]|jgi:Ca2+-transporting ATPase